MRVRGLIALSVIALVVPAILGPGSSAADDECGIGTTGIMSTDVAIAATTPCADIRVTSPVGGKGNQGTTWSFSASDSVVAQGEQIRLYEWDFDGNGSYDTSTTTANISHQYDDPGVYNVGLRITAGPSDSDVATDTATVRIVVWPVPNNPPVAAFDMATPAMVGVPHTFDAGTSHEDDPDGGITLYEWDWNGDGTYDTWSTSPVTTHTFTDPGPVTVGLRVTDERDAPDTAQGTITHSLIVTRPPIPDLTATPNVISPGGTVQFDGSGSTDPDGAGISLYEWDFDGDGTYDTSGTSPTTSHTYPVQGNYAATLRVTDGDGGKASKGVAVIVQNATPVARLTITPNPAVAGDSVLLDGSTSGDADGTIVRYDWDLDGNGTYETTTNGTSSMVWSYPNVTTVSVGLRVRDDDGSTGTTHVTLKVNAAPPAGGGGGTGGGTGGSTGGGTGGSTGTTGGGTTGDGTTGGGDDPGAGGGAGTPISASLGGSAIQKAKNVLKKGLALSCRADRASTCTVTATLSATDARRLKLASKTTKKPTVIGSARVTLKKAGSAALTLKLSTKARKALARSKQVRVTLSGIVTSGADRASVGRAVLVRR
jgi:YD repeat-containing protein